MQYSESSSRVGQKRFFFLGLIALFIVVFFCLWWLVCYSLQTANFSFVIPIRRQYINLLEQFDGKYGTNISQRYSIIPMEKLSFGGYAYLVHGFYVNATYNNGSIILLIRDRNNQTYQFKINVLLSPDTYDTRRYVTVSERSISQGIFQQKRYFIDTKNPDITPIFINVRSVLIMWTDSRTLTTIYDDLQKGKSFASDANVHVFDMELNKE